MWEGAKRHDEKHTKLFYMGNPLDGAYVLRPAKSP